MCDLEQVGEENIYPFMGKDYTYSHKQVSKTKPTFCFFESEFTSLEFVVTPDIPPKENQ